VGRHKGRGNKGEYGGYILYSHMKAEEMLKCSKKQGTGEEGEQ
jgi:hypothetical protein